MEKDGDAAEPSAAEGGETTPRPPKGVSKGERHLNFLERATGLDLGRAGAASKPARSMGYDVWVHLALALDLALALALALAT